MYNYKSMIFCILFFKINALNVIFVYLFINYGFASNLRFK